ncbi:MAG: hypothetical protein EOP88_19115 [Verrucomicrobiaceae bacterium]|nr:MAG: hypothetical protein EOP88_19115 [Verrucomicrobiaceae bacterium]
MSKRTAPENEKLDATNVGLLRMAYNLRQSLDLYRLVGLNATDLNERSPQLWAHIQILCHESIAVIICKMFENRSRNDLNSIPCIIALINPDCSDHQKFLIQQFAEKFEVSGKWTDAREFLRQAFDVFRDRHLETLNNLRKFRDKFVAHSEFGAEIESLASQDEFETLFDFAADFYRLVSDTLLNIGPALIGGPVGVQMFDLLKSIEVPDPKFKFPSDR